VHDTRGLAAFERNTNTDRDEQTVASLSESSLYRIAKALFVVQLTAFISPTPSKLRHVTTGNETLASYDVKILANFVNLLSLSALMIAFL